MIIASIVLGISTSLIPNIASANVKKDYHDLDRKVNQSLQALITTTLPMALGLSFLATPVWVIFYGYYTLIINMFSFYIFQAITYSFYTVLIDIMQTLNNSKISLGTLIGSFIAKALLNTPMMILFTKIGLEAYYAPIFTTLLTQIVSILFLLYKLKQKYHVHYFNTFKTGVKSILCVGIMVVSLAIIKLFIPVETTSRMSAFVITALYSIIGAIIYIICAFKSNLVYEVFGEKIVNGILRRIPFIKRLKHS